MRQDYLCNVTALLRVILASLGKSSDLSCQKSMKKTTKWEQGCRSDPLGSDVCCLVIDPSLHARVYQTNWCIGENICTYAVQFYKLKGSVFSVLLFTFVFLMLKKLFSDLVVVFKGRKLLEVQCLTLSDI